MLISMILFLGLPVLLLVLATGCARPVTVRARGGDPVAGPARR